MNTQVATRTGETVDVGEIRERIIAVLRVYPKLSATMIQVGVGNNLPAHSWKPVLEKMIDDGEVLKKTLFTVNKLTGRNQTHYVHMLIDELMDGGEVSDSASGEVGGSDGFD